MSWATETDLLRLGFRRGSSTGKYQGWWLVLPQFTINVTPEFSVRLERKTKFVMVKVNDLDDLERVIDWAR